MFLKALSVSSLVSTFVGEHRWPAQGILSSTATTSWRVIHFCFGGSDGSLQASDLQSSLAIGECAVVDIEKRCISWMFTRHWP